MLRVIKSFPHKVEKPAVGKEIKTGRPPSRGDLMQEESKEAPGSRQISIRLEPKPKVPSESKEKGKKHHYKPPKQNVINFIECADLLPSDKCIELDKGPNSQCDRPGQVRDELCRKTCHLCQGISTVNLMPGWIVAGVSGFNSTLLAIFGVDFPINRTDFTVQDSGPHDCLVTDVCYDGRYHLTTLKSAGLFRCKQVCTNDPRCMGFDFYVPLNEAVQGSCILSTVDLPTLKRRLNLKKVETGANAEDLSRMDAKLCIHFQRVRRPRKLPSLEVS